MGFRLKRPRTNQHKHTACLSVKNSFCLKKPLLGGIANQKYWQVEEIYIIYRQISDIFTKSIHFVKSSTENTSTRSSQENSLGEAAHNEYTTVTYIAVKPWNDENIRCTIGYLLSIWTCAGRIFI